MSTNHRKIKAVLHPNKLKNNEGTYKAQTIPHQTLNIDNICELVSINSNSATDARLNKYHVSLFLTQLTKSLTKVQTVVLTK